MSSWCSRYLRDLIVLWASLEGHRPLGYARLKISALRTSDSPVKDAGKTWMMFQRAEGGISEREGEGIGCPFSRPNSTETA